MSKIMLVEDDNNLREIYEARLLAEGYEIVSARDGEEALAMAVKEKPDLIISDVMMPKISGFDMLDILRTNPETQNTKVIMMTALSQAEDKARADKLGADRYLVKSQVTLEDVAKVAREVLTGGSDTAAIPADIASDIAAATAAQPVAQETFAAPAQAPAEPVPAPALPVPEPVAPVPAPAPPVNNDPATTAVTPDAVTPPTPAVFEPVQPVPAPVVAMDSTAAAAQDAAQLANAANDLLTTPTAPAVSDSGSTVASRIIQPLNDPTTVQPDLNELLAREEAKENAAVQPPATIVNPASDPNNAAL